MIDNQAAPQSEGGILDINRRVVASMSPSSDGVLGQLRALGVDPASLTRRPDAPMTDAQRNDLLWQNAKSMTGEMFDAALEGRWSDVSPSQVGSALVQAGTTKLLGQTAGAAIGGIYDEIQAIADFPMQSRNWFARLVTGKSLPELADAAFGGTAPLPVRMLASRGASADALLDDKFTARSRTVDPMASRGELAAAIGEYDPMSAPGIAGALSSAATQVGTAIALSSIPGGQVAGAARASTAIGRILAPAKALLGNPGGRVYLGYAGGRQAINRSADYLRFNEMDRNATSQYNAAIDRLGLGDVLDKQEVPEYSRMTDLGVSLASGAMTAFSEMIGTGFSVAAGKRIIGRLYGGFTPKAAEGGMREMLKASAKGFFASGSMEGLEEVVDGYGQAIIGGWYDWTEEGGFAWAEKTGGSFDPLAIFKKHAPELFYDFAIAFAVSAPLGAGGGIASVNRRRNWHDAFTKALMRDQIAVDETGATRGESDFLAAQAIAQTMAGGDPSILPSVLEHLRKTMPEIGQVTESQLRDPAWVAQFVRNFPLVAVRLSEMDGLSRTQSEWLTGTAARGRVPGADARGQFLELVRAELRNMIPTYMQGWYERSTAELEAYNRQLQELGDKTDDRSRLLRAQAKSRIKFILDIRKQVQLAWVNKETIDQSTFESWLRFDEAAESVDIDGTADAKETSPSTARSDAPGTDEVRARARAGDAEAAFTLAQMHESGQGAEQHFYKSQYWMSVALANSGDVEAMVYLGRMYAGRAGAYPPMAGSPRSINKARAWLRKAYELGSDEAGQLLAELETGSPARPRPGRIDAAEAAQAARRQQTPPAASAAQPAPATPQEAPAAPAASPAVSEAPSVAPVAQQPESAPVEADPAADTRRAVDARVAVEQRMQAEERAEAERRAADEADAPRREVERQVQQGTGDPGRRVRFVEAATPVEEKIAKAAGKLGKRVQFIRIFRDEAREGDRRRRTPSGIRGFVGSDANTIYLVQVPNVMREQATTAYYLQTLAHENAHGVIRETDAETLRQVDALSSRALIAEFERRFDLGKGEERREEIRVQTLTLGVVDAAGLDAILLADTAVEKTIARLKLLFGNLKIALTGNERAALLKRLTQEQVDRAKAAKEAEPAPAPAAAKPAATRASKPKRAPKPKPAPQPTDDLAELMRGGQYVVGTTIQSGIPIEVVADGKTVVVDSTSQSKGVELRIMRKKLYLLSGSTASVVTSARILDKPSVGKAKPKAAQPQATQSQAAQPQAAAEPAPQSLDLFKDGIEGSEIDAAQVPGGSDAFQYAVGKTEASGTVGVYRRRASERGTYGGWRWEMDPGRLQGQSQVDPANEPVASELPKPRRGRGKKGDGQQAMFMRERTDTQLAADHRAAFERGDESAAREIVREYGRRKGYDLEAYHGLSEGALEGNSFDAARLGKNTNAASARLGFFFSKTEGTAASYAQVDFDPDVSDAFAASLESAIRPLLSLVPDGVSMPLDYIRESLESGYENPFLPRNQDLLNPDLFADKVIDGIDYVLKDIEFRYDLNDPDMTDSEFIKEYPKNTGDRSKIRSAIDEARRVVADAGVRASSDILNHSVINVLLRMQQPMQFDQLGAKYRETSYYDIVSDAKSQGRDGVVIENTYDSMSEYGELDTVYVVFDPSQIKSADPFTYDSNGELIPLDKRFDDTTSDIRFLREKPGSAFEMFRDDSPASSRTNGLATALLWKYTILDRAVKAARRKMKIEPDDAANELFQLAPGISSRIMLDFGNAEVRPYEEAVKNLAKRLGMNKDKVMDLVQEHAFLKHALDVIAWLEKRDAVEIQRRADRAFTDLDAMGIEVSPDEIYEQVKDRMTALGLSKEQAQARLRELDKQFAADKAWSNLSDRLRAMNRKTLEIHRQAGNITEAAYQELVQRYPNYVPVVTSLFGDEVDQPTDSVKRPARRILRRMFGGMKVDQVANVDALRKFWAASWDLTKYDRMKAAHAASLVPADNAMFRLARQGALLMQGGDPLVEVVDMKALVEEQAMQDRMRLRRERDAAEAKALEDGVELPPFKIDDAALMREAALKVANDIDMQIAGSANDAPSIRRFKLERDTDLTPPEVYEDIHHFMETGLTVKQALANEQAAANGEKPKHTPLKPGTAAFDKRKDQLESRIKLMPKGTVMHYRINDPDLAQAMLLNEPTMLEKMRSEGGAITRNFAKAWMKLMAFQRFAFVSASPGFWKGELLRSPQQAAIMGRVMSEELGLSAEQKDAFLRNLDAIVGRFYPLIGVVGAARAMPGGKPWRSVRHVLRGNEPRNAYEQMVRKAIEDGVLQGGVYSVDSYETMVAKLKERIGRSMEGEPTLRQRASDRVDGVTAWASDVVDQITNGLDMVNRLNVYQAATMAGISRQQAAIMARESTVDFSKKGASMRGAGQIYLFLGPRMQGIHQLLRAFSTGEGKTMAARTLSSASKRILMRMFLWSFAFKMLREFFYEDDDEPQSVPSQFASLQNMLVPMMAWNDKKQHMYLEINNPYGFGAIAKLADRIGEFLVGDSTAVEMLAGAVGDFGSELTPLAFDLKRPTSVLQALTPTNLQVGTDLLLNQDWKGSLIYPEGAKFGPGEQRRSQQYFAANTWRTSIWLADVIADLTRPIFQTFGFEGQRGIEISPNQIQYVFQRWMPGFLRQVADGVSWASGQNVTIDRLPIVGSFVTQTGGQSVVSGQWRDMGTIRANMKVDLKEGRESRRQILERYGDVGRWFERGAYDNAERQIKKLQQARNVAMRAGKREVFDRINERIEEIQTRVLREYARIRERSSGGGIDAMFQRGVLN